ncbi:MAG: flagellar protein FlgN [Pseudomonadota bacterium]
MSERLHSITALLTKELELLQLVGDSIEREHEALLKNNLETLQQATKSKAQAVSDFREQQQLRLQWMRAHGLKTDSSLLDLVRAVADLEPRPEPLTDIRDLEDLAKSLNELALSCDSNNRRNGGLIVRLQEKTRNTLSVLRGEGASEDLYSDSGEKAPSTGSRSLGKA